MSDAPETSKSGTDAHKTDESASSNPTPGEGFAAKPFRMAAAAVGVVAGVGALLVLAAPSVAAAVERSIGPIVGSPVLVGIAGILAGGYGLVGFWRRGRDPGERPQIVESPPERAAYDRQDVAGESIDASVDTVGGELPEARSADYFTRREKQDVKNRLQTVAVNVLASEYDVPRDAAATMIADGSWTERERAAALLGGEQAASLSPRTQFVDWLSGNAYERRVEATVDEIARHAGVKTARDGSSPDGSSTDGSGPADSSADGSRADGSSAGGSSRNASAPSTSRTATESALPVSERDVPPSVATAIERAAATHEAADEEADGGEGVSLALDGPPAEGATTGSERRADGGEPTTGGDRG